MLPNDRPSDELIEDDGALDRWFDAYQRDMARKLGKRGGGGDSRLDLTGRSQTAIPVFGGPDAPVG